MVVVVVVVDVLATPLPGWEGVVVRTRQKRLAQEGQIEAGDLFQKFVTYLHQGTLAPSAAAPCPRQTFFLLSPLCDLLRKFLGQS